MGGCHPTRTHLTRAPLPPAQDGSGALSFFSGDIVGVGDESDRSYLQNAVSALVDQEEHSLREARKSGTSAAEAQQASQRISQAHREVWLMDRMEADTTAFSTKGQLKVLIVSLRHFVKLHLSCLFGLPGLVKALGVRDPHQAIAVGGQGDFFVCTKAHASALRIVLSQVPWLSRLSEAGLEDLVGHLQLRRYRPRQKIFAQGEAANDWFLLLHGSVTVEIQEAGTEGVEDAPLRELCRIHAVSAFGERGILWGCSRTSNVIALSECICASLPAKVPRRTLRARPRCMGHAAPPDTRRPAQVFLETMPARVLALLKSAMPPPEGHAEAHPEGGVAATGDAPPLMTDEHKKYKLRQLTFLGVLGKGSFGTVRLVQHKEAGQDGTAPTRLRCGP